MPNDPILFEAFAFAPEDGLKNHEYSPTEPESEDAIRAQIQGISDQLRDHVNTLKTQLNATESACSGAHRIGAAEIAGIGGRNVAQQLASLKTLIDETAVGAIPDDTIETAKLKDGIVTEAKLAQNAVTEDKLADGCVTGGKLADGAVTVEKLAQGMGDFYLRHLITTSGTWSPPYDGVYTITLIGGGGGGGSGFAVYDTSLNTNSSYPRAYFIGASGDASVAVTKRFALYQSETYTFVIGAGGNGRSGRNYVMSAAGVSYDTQPVFTSCDAFATVGGESSMAVGDKVLLNTSQRNKGCGHIVHVGMTTPGTKLDLYGGASGAGYFPGVRNTVKTSDTEITNGGKTLVIEGGPGLMGGGHGSSFSMAGHISGTQSPAGNATGYGCGGGGGCAPYIDRSTPTSSNKYSFINSGGKGGNGYALIEWSAPLALPQ